MRVCVRLISGFEGGDPQLMLINSPAAIERMIIFWEARMKESLRPGISKVRRLVVDRERTISFMGEEGRVYGTPELGRDIEHTCRDLLLEHAEVGQLGRHGDHRAACGTDTAWNGGRDHGDGDRGRGP